MMKMKQFINQFYPIPECLREPVLLSPFLRYSDFFQPSGDDGNDAAVIYRFGEALVIWHCGRMYCSRKLTA